MATETKVTHTPAPWHACNGGSVALEDGVQVVPTHVRRKFTDAQGRRVTQFIAMCNTGLSEHAANARLIAAAPDLLRFCKYALLVAELGNCLDGDTADELSALIAKVEGQ